MTLFYVMPYTNIETRRAKCREYYAKNKNKCNALTKAWAAANKEYCEDYQRRYYQEHKDEMLAKRKAWGNSTKNKSKVVGYSKKYRNSERGKAWRAKIDGELARYKESVGCLNPGCNWQGKYEACMLDFHHLDRSTKHKSVAQLKGSQAKMRAEIKKCTLLCSNCHRLVTYGKLDVRNLPHCDYIMTC